MVWKEIYAEQRGPRLHWLGRIVVALLVIGSFVPVVFIFYGFCLEGSTYERNWRNQTPWESLAQDMNILARVVGALVGTLLLVTVAVRAAASISGERDKKTFDELLASPLDSDEILYGKWLGSVLSVRWGWVWLGLIWGLALVTGGLNIIALPMLVSAWFIYASFLACLGLWFSMNCRTSMRATLWTLTSAVFLGVGHWLIWLLCIPLFRNGFFADLEFVIKLQAGITPPLALGVCLPFRAPDLISPRDKEWIELIFYGIAGMVFWVIAAGAFSGVLRNRFRQVTDRVNYGRTRTFDVADFGRPAYRARSDASANQDDLEGTL